MSPRLAMTVFTAFFVLVFPAARPAPAQELPRQLILQGERFLTMGKYESALRQYAKVIACCEKSPLGAEAHNDMGVACLRLGRTEEALAHYEAALYIADYPLARFNLGKLLLERYEAEGDPADGERALDLLTNFQQWLAATDPATLPPSVSFQREEMEAYLEASLRALASRLGGE